MREDHDRRRGTGEGGTRLTLRVRLMQFRSEDTPRPFCVHKSVQKNRQNFRLAVLIVCTPQSALVDADVSALNFHELNLEPQLCPRDPQIQTLFLSVRAMQVTVLSGVNRKC